MIWLKILRSSAPATQLNWSCRRRGALGWGWPNGLISKTVARVIWTLWAQSRMNHHSCQQQGPIVEMRIRRRRGRSSPTVIPRTSTHLEPCRWQFKRKLNHQLMQITKMIKLKSRKNWAKQFKSTYLRAIPRKSPKMSNQVKVVFSAQTTKSHHSSMWTGACSKRFVKSVKARMVPFTRSKLSRLLFFRVSSMEESN